MNNHCIFTSLRLCVKKETISLLILVLAASLIYTQNAFLIKDKRLNEISGIVASRVNPDMYYVHNDSGGKNEVYVIDSRGKTITTIILPGLTNRDWEDIAIGPGPDKNQSYVYIGEIGDNKAKHINVSLYRFPEPLLKSNGNKKIKPVTIPMDSLGIFNFVILDGAKDLETLFIDSANGDVYLVSKREEKVGLYQIQAPLIDTGINKAGRIQSFDFPLAVAGDISAQRDKIIIKTYSDIYCWSVLPNQSIPEALAQKPTILPYTVEPQGEAACWSADGKEYLTISEKVEKAQLYLNIYPFLP